MIVYDHAGNNTEILYVDTIQNLNELIRHLRREVEIKDQIIADHADSINELTNKLREEESTGHSLLRAKNERIAELQADVQRETARALAIEQQYTAWLKTLAKRI